MAEKVQGDSEIFYEKYLRINERKLARLETELAKFHVIFEAQDTSEGKVPGGALREPDREQFAKDLNELLRRAGIVEPGKVLSYKDHYYGISGKRVWELDQDSREWYAAEWLRTFENRKGLEAKLSEATDRRINPSKYPTYHHMPDEVEWLTEKVRELERHVAEATAPKPPGSGKPRKQASPEQAQRNEFQARRDDGRDRHNARRKANQDAWRAQVFALVQELTSKYPGESNFKLAKRIEKRLLEEWKAEARRRERDGEESQAFQPPRANTIRHQVGKTKKILLAHGQPVLARESADNETR